MTFDLLSSAVAVLILIIFSGLFSGTEAAFLAVSRAKLQSRKKDGDEKAGRVLRLKDKMEKVIGTLLVCNNLVNILSSALATSLFLQLVGDSGEYVATIVMTILIVIFAEIVPKFYAMQRAEPYATLMVGPLIFLIKFLMPITLIFEKVARTILGVFGVKIKSGQTLSSSLDELRGVIDMHGGDEESIEERAMLHSVLDLGDVSIEEVMVHRKSVIMIDLDEQPAKIINQIIASYHTRLPIYQHREDNILGTIHAKSFLRLVNEEIHHGREITKQDILSFAKKPWFVPETTTLFEQLQAFRKKREHMAFVVDEYGAFQGIVTLEDIIEEIVGDIDDEYDPNNTGFWQTANGEIFAIGSSTLRDLNRHFDWQLPAEEATTIGGLLMHESRNIPKIGQTFIVEGFRIRVLRRLRNQITLVKIQPPIKKQLQTNSL